ncbi:MAG: lipid A export permease/ATP-binding protein MsbA [Burkholderiales bacterium]|nr:lipid A export permease/ATP-binding protein MsbA [Burkholderiales bacterium]
MTPARASSLQLYLRLLRYVRPYWRVFAAGVFLMAIVAATEPAVPALIKPILDGGFVDKDTTLIRWAPFLLIGLAFVRAVAGFGSDYCGHWVATRVVADLRMEMFGTLVRLPTRYYDNTTTGRLISRFTFDVAQVAGAATGAITVIVKDGLSGIGLIAYLLYTNWKLTLITFAVMPLLVYVMRAFAARLRRMSVSEQAAMGDLNHVLEESIGGERVLKVFGAQAYETGRFRGAVEKVRRFAMKSNAAAAATVPLTQVILSFAVALIVYLALEQAAADKTTVGGFVAFLGAMLLLNGPLKRLAGVNQTLQRGLAAAESVFTLIDEQREADTGKRDIGRVRGEIEFRDVSFEYEGATREALTRVSFRIAPGETVAIVGASGSGKTTVANLIPRFYTPTAGTITIDGVDIQDATLESLRRNIALVSQDVVLFNDTVAANIAYGRGGEVRPEEIAAAAEAAHAAGFVRELPAGHDTLIGEDGARLSGGQRQRLAIARAFLKDAPILVLDEATSALDTESERQVQEALETLMRGRTTLVIAHRLSTIQNADRILVMDRGRIVESGRHAELLAAGGIYERLHRMQFREGEAEAVAAAS